MRIMSCMKRIFTMNLAEDKAAVVSDICKALGAWHGVLRNDKCAVRVADILENPDVQNMPECGESRKLNMEMAIFAGISSKELDIFLERYKRSGAEPIALKSVITDTNKTWTLEKLYSELAREYMFYKMHGK